MAEPKLEREAALDRFVRQSLRQRQPRRP
jgi:hypothetical protein